MPSVLKGGFPPSAAETSELYVVADGPTTIQTSDTSALVVGLDFVIANGNDKIICRLASKTKNSITFSPISSPVNAVNGTTFPAKSIVLLVGVAPAGAAFQGIVPINTTFLDDQQSPTLIPELTTPLSSANIRTIHVKLRRGSDNFFNGTLRINAGPSGVEFSLEGLETGNPGFNMSAALNGSNVEVYYVTEAQGVEAQVRFYVEDDLL